MENQQKEMSPKEMAERKSKLTQFYKDQIEFLKTQLEYETLLADVEDQRVVEFSLTLDLIDHSPGVVVRMLRKAREDLHQSALEGFFLFRDRVP